MLIALRVTGVSISQLAPLCKVQFSYILHRYFLLLLLKLAKHVFCFPPISRFIRKRRVPVLAGNFSCVKLNVEQMEALEEYEA